MTRSRGSRATSKRGQNKEYWGRRPLKGGITPGRYAKTVAHRIERRRDKKLERDESA